jgi:uncharacterized alpha-E superfamily protein
MERAENTARLINVYSNLMLDLPRGFALGWKPLIRILGCADDYYALHEEVTERRVVNFLVSDINNPSSILSSISLARENARTIREILPREGWEELNSLYQHVSETKHASNARNGRHDYLVGIIRKLQEHIGLLAGTMNHDTAYNFLNLGRKLERADMTTRTIDVQSDNPIPEDVQELRPFEDTLLLSMLESLGAYQMYRQSMQTRISRSGVLNFLLKKQNFPRSLTYCSENLAYNLSALPNNAEPLKIIAHIEKVLEKAPVTEMNDEALHNFVDQMQIYLGNLHQSIGDAYFPLVTKELQQSQAMG